MSVDISNAMKDWPYEPGQITVRRIVGEDGRQKIQLRMDLGLLQMEVTGRPDGERPHGFESLLEYYEHQLLLHRGTKGSDEGFSLDEQACELLRAEGTMYYHRYLAEFVLEDFEAVERDAQRNLRLMDLCGRHAGEEADKFRLEQFRPYVLMMLTRARARIAQRDNRARAALEVVRNGIEKIRAFYRRFAQDEAAAESPEIAVLAAMEKEIKAAMPVDPLEQLRKKLAKAIRDERYEEAAGIRDQIRKVHEARPHPGPPPAEDPGEQ